MFSNFYNNSFNHFFFKILVTKEDYALLEAMNKVTKDKYNDMFYLAENLNTLMKSLQEKCIFYSSTLLNISNDSNSNPNSNSLDDSFAPYLEQIDQIDENVTQLEEATRQLDDYSKRLGNFFFLFSFFFYFSIFKI